MSDGQADMHPREALQELLDGRLPQSAADAVRAHLAGCESCRTELARVDEGRRAAALLRVDRDLPPDLATSLEALLDAEDSPQRLPGRRWAIVGGLTAAAALLLGVWWTRTQDGTPTLPDQAARDFVGLERGDLALDLRTSQPAELERFLAASANERSLPRVRVIDLAMMQFTLEGGGPHTLAGRNSALFAYRGPAGERLLCQMFQGRLDELPPTTDLRRQGAFTFAVFDRDGITLVFWQEGDTVCVLVSRMAKESVVALAMAKAML